jgi:lysophospholipase L1-like esterase
MIKDSAKTILCYGDSNTWGNVPRSDERYPRSVRWPGVLQNLLGDEYEVISEGLCGRTFVAEDLKKPHRTGITHLRAILESADPIDVVVVMLGTNDVKTTYNLSPEIIAQHLEKTIELIKSSDNELEKISRIIVICPPPVIVPVTNDLDEGMVNGIELFKYLPGLYKEVSERHRCDFINAGDYVKSSSIDGYHLDAGSHLALAEVIKNQILR